MDLLKELFLINKAEALSEGKKSGVINVDVLKPRNKHVNDILRSKKGGRHHDRKSDFKRAKQKSDAHERGVEEFI
jgi:hypothetical protein